MAIAQEEGSGTVAAAPPIPTAAAAAAVVDKSNSKADEQTKDSDGATGLVAAPKGDSGVSGRSAETKEPMRTDAISTAPPKVAIAMTEESIKTVTTSKDEAKAPTPQSQLFAAIKDGDIPAIQSAVKEWGADINAVTGSHLGKSTPLHMAIANITGHSGELVAKMIRVLVSLGASPIRLGPSGLFPLHVAVNTRSKEAMAAVLSSAADAPSKAAAAGYLIASSSSSSRHYYCHSLHPIASCTTRD